MGNVPNVVTFIGQLAVVAVYLGLAIMWHRQRKRLTASNKEIIKHEVNMAVVNMTRGYTGPPGPIGTPGRGFSDDEQRRLDARIESVALRAQDKIDDREFERLTEMIYSSDIENLTVAEAAIYQLNNKEVQVGS